MKQLSLMKLKLKLTMKMKSKRLMLSRAVCPVRLFYCFTI